MSRRLGSENGVATVEFALVLSVLLGLIALAWPLGSTFASKLTLDRALNDVVRYATAAPNAPAYDPDGGATTRRPTCTEVTHEVYRALGISGDTSAQAQYTIPPFSCPSNLAPGQTFTITVTRTSNLGPLGDLLSMAGITHSSTVAVSATASGREE